MNTTIVPRDYASLCEAVTEWLNRDDLGGRVRDFIELAERRLRRRFLNLPQLSGQEPTNWLITSNPDIYLAASIIEASAWCHDYATVELWEAKLSEMFGERTASAIEAREGEDAERLHAKHESAVPQGDAKP